MASYNGSSSTAASDPTPKCGNPYKTLNLPNLAKNIQIKKAFRNLSLQLHPDKRKPNLTKKQHDELDLQFIKVQEAKSFLLDAEFSTQREKYDLKLKGEGRRMEEDKKREEQMGTRRKNMRDDLQDRINREMAKKNKSSSTPSQYADVDDHMDGLKKAGKRMREAYSEKRQSEEQRGVHREHKKQKHELQNRQVRVKWSRAKMGGQSDHMIAKLLSSQFGEVEHVELIGRKGNAALVTFSNSRSCKPCVDAYLRSDEMRATYIGKRKDDEDRMNDDIDGIFHNSTSRERDRESVEERKLRQEAEREKMLRQMEDEKYDDKIGSKSSDRTSKRKEEKKRKHKSLFPPLFPSVEANKLGERPSYFERLEQMERIILKDLIPADELRKAQTLTL